MKRSRQLALVAIAEMPLLLAGCAHDDAATRQGFYTSVEACRNDGNSAEVCERALQVANGASTAKDAPRYKTKAECVAEYGDLCNQRQQEGGLWMPLMTGFMISQMLSPNRGAMLLDSSPVYRTRNGQYATMSRDGAAGAASMRPVDIAPNRAVTRARSGFGSRSAARSGWSGSRGGWGG